MTRSASIGRCSTAAAGILPLPAFALAEPPVPQDFPWLIAGIVMLCLIQGVLIAALLIQRAKCRRSEAAATLIADISAKFVNLPPGEVDAEITDAQIRVCEFFGLDFATLWHCPDESAGALKLTHFYSAQAGPQPPEQMNQDQYPWAREQVLAGRIIKISSPAELPPEAASDRDTLRKFGIRSNLALPLSVGGGAPSGMLGLGTTGAERDWPDALVEALQAVARTFANALARKRANEALCQSEERMSLGVNAAQLGIWSWSIPGNEIWGTERWHQLFGFAAGEEVDFEKVIQRIHSDDRKRVEQSVRRVVANQDDYAAEFRVVLPDGTRRWISSRGRMHADADGAPARMLGTAIDITERKQVEKAFRASEARLAAGVDLAGLGYYEVDYGERHCFLDARFREICGVPKDRREAMQPVEFWMEHVHPDDLPRVLADRQIMHDGKIDHMSTEYRYLHPAQGQKWIHHLARIAGRDDAGGGVRTFGVIRDITEQRRAEMEAQELRGNLAHADRVTMLGQLASALAHELSQPLGAILRNAEAAEIMLRDSAPDLEELRAIVSDILSDDQRAGQVIDRLRSLLKKGRLELQPVDLQDVITAVMSLVHADAAVRHVQLASTIMPDLPMVHGDRVHLQQVLLNLLVNAMDALDACTAECEIRVSARQTNPNTVEVRVCDNGPGITPETLGRLFEPFFTTKATGMGMGLPVSKSIIEAHKGELRAENGPNGGACFCFTVPVAGGG